MEEIIYQWIDSLLQEGKNYQNLIHPHFFIEDGMNFQEYFQHESYLFQNISKKFDLDKKFSIQIIDVEPITKTKNYIFMYLLNKFKKIVCKMNITIEDNLISSNNFWSQIVPKYVIEKNQIQEIGLAIKSPFFIQDIVSQKLEKKLFEKGFNFEKDTFYNARFTKEAIENQKIPFYLYFDNHKIEKRKVFFDSFRKEDCPYIIQKNILFINNEKYPVNIAIHKKNHEKINVEYPRDFQIELKEVKQAIITDVLDNDWIFQNN